MTPRGYLKTTLDYLKIIVGKRWPLILGLFVLELAVVLIVSNAPFFPGEEAVFQKEYNSLTPVLQQSAPGQVAGIFSNNFRVAIIELVPALGLAIMGLSLYETARIVEVIAVVKGIPVAESLATLFLLPSTWLELPAYAIAAAEGVYLVCSVYLGFKKGWSRFARELRFLVVNVLLIALVLIVAATFEVTEIQIEGTPDPSLALITWIPCVVVFVVAARFWRSAKIEAPALEQAMEERDAAEMAAAVAATPIVASTGPAPGLVRYCPSCGKPFEGSPAFCMNCGRPLPR